jgi:hypothetical protein
MRRDIIIIILHVYNRDIYLETLTIKSEATCSLHVAYKNSQKLAKLAKNSQKLAETRNLINI